MKLQGSLLGLFILVISCVLLTGCVRLTDPNGHPLQTGRDDGGSYVKAETLASLDSTPTDRQLVANVKGSIYETGEQMTVFGTCLDAYDEVINGTTVATFDAWYPNTTQFVTDYPMINFQPGYFQYQTDMSSVQGTYLTQMTCAANISGVMYYAIATGEWQNPAWVRRIAQLNSTLYSLNGTVSNISNTVNSINSTVNSINTTVNSINTTVGNISLQVANLQVNMTNSFNITWTKLDQLNSTINASVYALNQSIYYAAGVANASVDRNDSYLALLLVNLTHAVSPSGALNHTEVADSPVYHETWSILVTARNPTNGKVVRFPDADCEITTSQTTPAVAMTPQGANFIYTELIQTLSPFTWTVTCTYA